MASSGGVGGGRAGRSAAAGAVGPRARATLITPVAWVVTGALEQADWLAAGRSLGAMGRCSRWWLGDWIRYGNAKFGERYSRAAAITGYDSQTLMNMVSIASKFEISRRREDLSWSHHETVAALQVEEQEGWLDRAATERLSVVDLRLELRAARKGERQRAEAAVEGESGDPALQSVEDGAGSSVDDEASMVCPKCGHEMARAVTEPDHLLVARGS